MAWQFLSADQSSRLTGSQRGATPCCRWLSGLIIGRLRALFPRRRCSTYSDKLHKRRTIIHCQRASRGDAVRCYNRHTVKSAYPESSFWFKQCGREAEEEFLLENLFNRSWRNKSWKNKTWNINQHVVFVATPQSQWHFPAVFVQNITIFYIFNNTTKDGVSTFVTMTPLKLFSSRACSKKTDFLTMSVSTKN